MEDKIGLRMEDIHIRGNVPQCKRPPDLYPTSSKVTKILLTMITLNRSRETTHKPRTFLQTNGRG